MYETDLRVVDLNQVDLRNINQEFAKWKRSEEDVEYLGRRGRLDKNKRDQFR